MNNSIKFGINVTTFNRFNYCRDMLESLKNTEFLYETIIIITDDCSTDKNLISYLNHYSIDNPKVKIKKFFNSRNLGSKNNYINSLANFVDEPVDFIVNLDSDCLLNRKWLTKNKEIIDIFGENILSSSFCCRYHHGNPNNRLELLNENFYERDTLNGLGICFPKRILQDFQISTEKHFDDYLCNVVKNKYAMRCICTKNSYIQHIGIIGVHSVDYSTCDISDNFIGV